MDNTLNNLSGAQLRKAAAIKERIEELERELGGILGTSGGSVTNDSTSGRRTMSAEARAKIAAAQRARWAKAKGGKAKPATKRTMSAAARKKISDAAKARWAKVKAANK